VKRSENCVQYKCTDDFVGEARLGKRRFSLKSRRQRSVFAGRKNCVTQVQNNNTMILSECTVQNNTMLLHIKKKKIKISQSPLR
jgi:hypothetical protein